MSRAKRAGDGQHLLFAARQRHAVLLAAFAQAGEQLVDPLQRPADRRGDLGELQVFLDRQAGDDPPVLGHQRDARDRRPDSEFIWCSGL